MRVYQKNFPLWLYGRMTRKSRVETVVIRKNVQKSHRSIVSASIFHSLRMRSSLACG